MPLFWTWTQALPSSLKNKKNFRNCFSQHEVMPSCGPISLGTCRDLSSVRIAGGLNPLPHLAEPLPLVKILPRGVEFQPPHLRLAEVGMLLDSHFLLMQFLKYLGLHHDDLNVTTS